MGLVLYYGLAIIVFIAFCIYDLLFYMEYKDDECPEIQYTTARLLIDLHNHRVQITTNDTTTNTTATDTAVATVTNTVVLMPLFLVMLYGGIIVLCLFAMLGIHCFGGMSSDRFGNLSNISHLIIRYVLGLLWNLCQELCIPNQITLIGCTNPHWNTCCTHLLQCRVLGG